MHSIRAFTVQSAGIICDFCAANRCRHGRTTTVLANRTHHIVITRRNFIWPSFVTLFVKSIIQRRNPRTYACTARGPVRNTGIRRERGLVLLRFSFCYLCVQQYSILSWRLLLTYMALETRNYVLLGWYSMHNINNKNKIFFYYCTFFINTWFVNLYRYLYDILYII